MKVDMTHGAHQRQKKGQKKKESVTIERLLTTDCRSDRLLVMDADAIDD